jgi:rare lipoprotein A
MHYVIRHLPKEEVLMASLQIKKLLALSATLCQLFLPLQTLPLQAQETAIQKNQAENVPADNAVDGKKGIATYYANRYKGMKTSSGVRYHPDKLTAASPDLPLGSKVRVKNLGNGKEVLVTINDRCRRRRLPNIDLSKAAAKILGFFGRGAIRVSINPVEDEPS